MKKLIYDGVQYDNEITVPATLDMYHSMVGETLSVDVLNIPVIVEENSPEFKRSEPGYFYVGSDLVGKYYMNELRQQSSRDFSMWFYSAIRLLDRTKHLGGLYSGETAGTVLADIMGGVPYTVDSDVAAIEIYGYLPYATRRENLQMFLMATGAAVRNSADGSLRITSLSDTVVGTFAADRVFIGGVEVDKNPVTAVSVTEHNFIPSTETITVYDNASITTETIYFAEPFHNYGITNGTIIDSGANYVTFTGAGQVEITAQKYIHIQRSIYHGQPLTGSTDDSVRTVSSNTLINPFNATDVAERVYNYLSIGKSIKQEVVFGAERPGDVVNVMHPHTKQLVTATVKSMSPIQFGYTEARAQTEFLVGYTPPSLIAGFKNHIVLTGSGSWTVPAGVTKIRAILVGSGGGGGGGGNGEDGKFVTSPSLGGLGGLGGSEGVGGKILETNLVVAPLSSLAYSCGVGGSGGLVAQDGNPGSNTVLDIYSSFVGREYLDGYSEPKTGLVLGKRGDKGVNGGSGRHYDGTSDTVVVGTSSYDAGNNGADVYGNYSGNTGYAIGGGGGGAAVGADGSDGTDGYWQWHNYLHDDPYTGYWAHHGSGGNGADATIDGAAGGGYGQAGSGGHGGGGGGWAAGNLPHFDYPGKPGSGGAGSSGGNGGDGCIVIYY